MPSDESTSDESTDVERRIRDALAVGERLDLRPAGPHGAGPQGVGPHEGMPVVRGPALAEMLLDAGQAAAGHTGGMWVVGARIVGPLRLAFGDVRYSLLLEDCVFEQRPDLYWAKLGFTSFARSRMPGLMASNAVVDGHLWLNDCEITDEARLLGARISGGLLMTGARCTAEGGATLNAERLVVGGDLLCRDAVFDGSVRLFHARVSGSADFDGARINAPGRVALAGDSLGVDGGMFCRGCHVDGEVSLRHARISDALTFSNSVIRNPGSVALRLDRASIDGGVFLLQGFSAHGEVRAVSARIGRTFGLNGAELVAPGQIALRADAVVVDGMLDGRGGLRVDGEFRIDDATINGPVRLDGAHLRNPGANALCANGAQVGSVFTCADGFTATGAVRMSSVRVGSRLTFDGASLITPDGTSLKCWRAQAAELTIRWAHPPDGALDLRHARIGVLRDDAATWPAVIRLDGLIYDILDPSTDASGRLEWLARDPDSHQRQPYEQLAAVMRAHGNDDQARTLLLARQRRDTRAAAPPMRLWGYLQDVTVGYGYRPLYAALWFAVLLILGSTAFAFDHPDAIEPAKAPPFNAPVYTLDLLLPLVDFGQESAYTPTGTQQWLAYGLIAAGLVLATTVAAGVTRSLRRT